MAQVLATSKTGDNRIDALLGNLHWAPASAGTPTSITISFPLPGATWSNAVGEYYSGDSLEPLNGFGSLTSLQQGAVRNVLAEWAAVANVAFTEIADAYPVAGTLRFAWTTLASGVQADSYVPNTLEKSGDVWLNTKAFWEGFGPGTYGYSTLLHEIGHALGLKHAFDAPVQLPAAENGYLWTVMGDSAYAGASGSWAGIEPSTPMLYDVLAIQSIYGANTGWRTGDDTYVFAQGADYLQTIWDAGGTDTIRWDASTQPATIDLRDGRFSSLGDPVTYWDRTFTSSWTDPRTVAIAFGTTIENAVGGMAGDTLTGNASVNVLMGRDGDDTLAGGGGDDVVDGGNGTDTAVLGAASAGATVTSGGGRFRVTAGTEGSDTLVSIEKLQFTDKAFTLSNPALDHVPQYGKDVFFLFDSVYYLLDNDGLVPTLGVDNALQHWYATGSAQHLSPAPWFDPVYYANKWADLTPLHLDDRTLFMHFNGYGVWEGRSPGPKFDHFDGNRYLTENTDVAAYVDAHLADFLGSRTNGAIAHFIIDGNREQRVAYDTGGTAVDMGFTVTLIGSAPDAAISPGPGIGAGE